MGEGFYQKNSKKMPYEIAALLVIAALVVGLIVNLKKVDKDAQTLAETWFANVSEPQFYQQRDPTVEAAQSARAEWENAVKMHLECGNSFIQKKDLYLVLWRASHNDEKVEFSAWQALASENQRKIKEAWIAAKSENLKQKPEEMARVVWGNDEPEKMN